MLIGPDYSLLTVEAGSEPAPEVKVTEYGLEDVTITMTNNYLPTDDDGLNVTKLIQQGNYDGLFNGTMGRDFEFLWDWEGNWDESGNLPEHVALPVTMHVAFLEPSRLTEVTVYNANKSNGFVTKAEAVLNYSDGTTSEKLVIDAEMADYAPFAFEWEDNGKTVASVDITLLEAINYSGSSVTNMLTLAELELSHTEVEEVVEPEMKEYGQSDVALTMTNEFLPSDDGSNVTSLIQQGNYDGLFNGAMGRDFEFLWDYSGNWDAEGKLPEYVALPVTIHVTFNEPSKLTEVNVYNANKGNGYITKASAVLHYSDGTDSQERVITLTELANYAPFEFVWSDNGKTVESVDITILEAITSTGASVSNMLTLAELELKYTEGTQVPGEHVHTPAEAVRENVVDATCTEDGSYDSVVYCSECGEEISRETVTVPALGHNYDNGVCTECGHARNPFVDVPEDSFYIESVLWAVEEGITTGLDATHFGPTTACNRAQVVTFLWRAAGAPEPTITENPFVDVPADAFYYNAVLWAVENGITTGISPDHFNPTGQCNRAQVVTFLWRAMGEPEATNTENPFSDVLAGEFYTSAVAWAVENGITTGVDATHFGPTTACNRAQVVTFLYRTYNK